MGVGSPFGLACEVPCVAVWAPVGAGFGLGSSSAACVLDGGECEERANAVSVSALPAGHGLGRFMPGCGSSGRFT